MPLLVRPSPPPPLRLVLSLALLTCVLLGGCDSAPGEAPTVQAVAQEVDDAIAQGDDEDTQAMAWVASMGKPATGSADQEFSVRPAAREDEEYRGTATVPVRRLVYRVRFIVPGIFRRRNPDLLPQAGELHVDVADHRLRARFLGPGWPVHAGAEVRLRDDMPGVYAFDGHGGRWLAPGDMATWFDGKVDGKPQSRVRIRREFGASDRADTGPGELLCALLSEWTNQPREALEGRCRGDSIAPGFRFGPWSAELTAIVPMRLPKQALRADHIDPPHVSEHGHHGAMLSDTEVDQLRPAPPAGDGAEALAAQAEETRLRPRGAPRLARLVVHNQADARVILLSRGVPLGWVDSEQDGEFALPPGTYRMGAIRPLGLVRMGKREVSVPGEVTVERPRHLRTSE